MEIHPMGLTPLAIWFLVSQVEPSQTGEAEMTGWWAVTWGTWEKGTNGLAADRKSARSGSRLCTEV
jgi:hypothetical protein